MKLSLQLAHRLEDKNILLVGGGEVALTRLEKLVSTGSKVTLVAPEILPEILEKFCPFFEVTDKHDQINPNWENCKGKEVYRVIRDRYEESHLKLYQQKNSSNWSFIMTCIPNPELSEKIYRTAKELFGQQQMVNVADNPPLCDFYFGANLILNKEKEESTESLLQIMISSNGAAPRFTALVKNEIADLIKDLNLKDSVDVLGDLRAQIRAKSNNPDDLKYRMQWIKKCTNIFGIKYCHLIKIDEVLKLYDEMYKNDKSLEFPHSDEMLKTYLKKEPTEVECK